MNSPSRAIECSMGLVFWQGYTGATVRLGWVGERPLFALILGSVLPSLQDSTGRSQPGRPVARPAGLLTAPRPCGGTRRRETPPCLCVLGRENHPLAGYCRVLLPLFSPVQEGSGKAVGSGGGGDGGTCLLHSWLLSGSCVPSAPGPVGRLESLTLSPPWSSGPGLATS